MEINKIPNISNDDPEGLNTLQIIAGADNFNRWMYETVKPYCNGSILEIGSGIGNISKYFLEEDLQLDMSDMRKAYCLHLKTINNKFKPRNVFEMDLIDPMFQTKFSSLKERYDTIFALNVFEHIENDDLALTNTISMLRPNGRLIILVPAFEFLFNKFDEQLGHYRRYTLRSLELKFTDHKLKIQTQHYFNFLGILGWFVSGTLLKNNSIPGAQMNLFNRLVPFAKQLDKLFNQIAGLSVIVIGQKTS